MPQIVRSDFPQLMVDGLSVLWDQTNEGMETYFPRFYKVDESNKMFETSIGMVGLGTIPRKPEAVRVRYDQPRQGRPVTYIHQTYSLAVGISREAKEDDRSGKLAAQIIPELANAMHITREIDAAAPFNNAFTAQGYEPDGVALISTAHPLLRPLAGGATTWSNRSATDAALGITSLQAMRAILWRTLSENGRPMPQRGVRLIVPPELESLAEELMQSTGKPTASAAQNETNVLKGKFTVEVWPFLTGTGKWFIQADNHKMRWWNRRMPDFKSTEDWDADVLKSKTSARWSRGFDDPRGMAGSAGP